MIPTDEQTAILAAAADPARPNLMIRAYAGCGKTSTLRLISGVITEPTLYVVFNRKNREEAEGRFPSHVQVRTSNGLGHAAWGRALGKRLVVDDKKLGRIIKARIGVIPASERDPELWGIVRDLCVGAMQIGIIPDCARVSFRGLVEDNEDEWRVLGGDAGEPTADAISLARDCLASSIKEGFAGIISFDDQIYLPSLMGGQFPRFPTVFVDELQDQSPLQHRRSTHGAAQTRSRCRTSANCASAGSISPSPRRSGARKRWYAVAPPTPRASAPTRAIPRV